MSVKVTVDGTAYTGLDTLTAGGKTFALEAEGGGGTNPLASPVASLESRWQYAIFELDQDFVVDANGIITNFAGVSCSPLSKRMFYNARNVKSITLRNVLSPQRPAQGNFLVPDLTSAFEKDTYFGTGGNPTTYDLLEAVTIETIDNNPIQPQSAVFVFSGRTNLREVNAVFDLSKINPYGDGYNFRQMFNNCSALEEVRFAPNTILWMSTSYQLFNVSQVLSDASLVSIANALAVGSAAPNLRLLSTPYARCSTLMGTVADGLFTKNDSGTVSLADFITNTKGWTLYT